MRQTGDELRYNPFEEVGMEFIPLPKESFLKKNHYETTKNCKIAA